MLDWALYNVVSENYKNYKKLIFNDTHTVTFGESLIVSQDFPNNLIVTQSQSLNKKNQFTNVSVELN